MPAEITEDDFLTWRENAVTRWVFAAAGRAVEAQRIGWEAMSWDTGECDPVMLAVLRTRADAYRALYETTYADWKSLHETPDA